VEYTYPVGMPLPETDFTVIVKMTGTPEFCGLALEATL
jgi:hypothetical protein